MSPAHADFDAEGRDRAMLDADRLPRRAPPEPSAAAIEAAAKTEIGECIYREWQRARKDGMQGQERDFAFAVVRSMLRAAYAVDAPRGVPVTVERLEELLLMSNSWETGAKVPPKFSGRDARLFARWLHAHLVPPEAP